MEEIWKGVAGREKDYEVSNMGNVRTLSVYHPSLKNKNLKTQIDKYGYERVMLNKGDRLYVHVHRLVAEAFIPNPDPINKTQVNHINEDKTDNRACNLEWMSPKENTNHGTGIQRRTAKKSKPVLQYDFNGNFIKEWPSSRECGRNGFTQTSVNDCCLGIRKKHKGYIWKYK